MVVEASLSEPHTSETACAWCLGRPYLPNLISVEKVDAISKIFSLHETQQLAKLMAASDENSWDLETLCGVSDF